MYFQLLTCIDAPIAKFDKALTPDQDLLELAVRDFVDKAKEAFQNDEGNFKHVDEWPGVELSSDGKVSKIIFRKFFSFYERGSQIHFDCIPDTTQEVNFDGNAFLGTVDTATLPFELRTLRANYNQLSSTLDLSSLPPSLQMLCLSFNKLSGSVNLTNLPENLKELSLASNAFSGRVDFTALPRRMERLMLNLNSFKGRVDLMYIPASMQMLDISWNEFVGTIDFLVCRKNGVTVMAVQNKLTAVLNKGDKQSV